MGSNPIFINLKRPVILKKGMAIVIDRNILEIKPDDYIKLFFYIKNFVLYEREHGNIIIKASLVLSYGEGEEGFCDVIYRNMITEVNLLDFYVFLTFFRSVASESVTQSTNSRIELNDYLSSENTEQKILIETEFETSIDNKILKKRRMTEEQEIEIRRSYRVIIDYIWS